jgi:hypothetical protein
MADRKVGSYLDGGVDIKKAFYGVSGASELKENDILLTGIKTNCGLLIVKDVTNGLSAIYRIEGAGNVTISANAIFTITKDTASKVNVYLEGGQYKVQNKTTNTIGVKIGFLGI